MLLGADTHMLANGGFSGMLSQLCAQGNISKHKQNPQLPLTLWICFICQHHSELCQGAQLLLQAVIVHIWLDEDHSHTGHSS